VTVIGKLLARKGILSKREQELRAREQELLERFRSILEISTSGEGPIKKADEIEGGKIFLPKEVSTIVR
jgi:hypothetical protein